MTGSVVVRRHPLAWSLTMLLVAGAAGAAFYGFVDGHDARQSGPPVAVVDNRQRATTSYVIGSEGPAGDENDVPRHIVTTVGAVLRFENRSARGAQIGPLYVAAHSTRSFTFPAPGRFVADCNVHRRHTITIDIEPTDPTQRGIT